jgi:AraC-like DNA-binding protein
MPGSVTSVFGEPDDFQAALRAEGVLSLLITGLGAFRGRLTQVTLHDLRLSAGDEHLPRIAFVAVPADMLLVVLPIGDGPAPVWGGGDTRAGELITFGPGQRVHSRTDGSCRWGDIRLPHEGFAQYNCVMSGAAFVLPAAARWRPRRAPLRELRGLHRAALRRVEAGSDVLADNEAAHGLEQQLIHALVECLSPGPVDEEMEATRPQRETLARFEELLAAEPPADIRDICAALGVSQRMLRECCNKHLGMGPGRYRLLRGMQRVHRALRRGNPEIMSISAIAGRYGLRDLDRFAASYRALYGQSPTATLQQNLRQRSKW